jgi:DNA-directed RNA polymerase
MHLNESIESIDTKGPLMTELTVENLTIDRYERQTNRQIKSYGYGSTDGGLAICQRYLQETYDNVMLSIDPKGLKDSYNINHRTFRDKREAIVALDPYVISLVCLQAGLTAVANGGPLRELQSTLGKVLEEEVHAHTFKNYNEIQDNAFRRAMQSRSTKHTRKQLFRTYVKNAGLSLDQWCHRDHVTYGSWLVNILLKGSAFTLQDDYGPIVCLTEEALRVSDDMVRMILEKRPVLLPVFERPDDWISEAMKIQGYHKHLIKSHDKVVRNAVSSYIREGRMKKPLEAINRYQSTPWRINQRVLEMVKWSYDQNLAIGGLPPINNLAPLKRPTDFDSLTEDQQRQWKYDAQKTRRINNGYTGCRLVTSQFMITADHIGDRTFYIPQSYDRRGRMYGMTYFNYQQADYVRSLFLLDQGEPIGDDDEALSWLMVHVANSGDFDKVSKKPYVDRIEWTHGNLQKIVSTADNPKEDLWWTEADKPFQFLAACMELVNTLRDPHGYVCRLPVSFDGSCSGLQHLSALTRDQEVASKVNLTNLETPQDIYQAVADYVKQEVLKDSNDHEDPDVRAIANLVLSYGIDRKLVKRNVMTYAYSSNVGGMSDQQMEDLMNPLSDKVIRGELEKHPLAYGVDKIGRPDKGHKAARYIAQKSYRGIQSIAKGPAEAMRFLRQIARALSHEGKHVEWKTPNDFLVVDRHVEYDVQHVKLALYDRGVKVTFNPNVYEPTATINKTRATSAIAPDFVHSLDACHLQSVILRCAEEDIDLALVHDSFGCLPTKATRMREILNEEFVRLYSDHDPLQRILETSLGRVTDPKRLPEKPTYGTLDIEGITNASYAFS